ncbi:multiple monosaccharide ABC transporter substrate-binding protein [Microbacterium oleivorans]|uniref:Sugar ABC transporter substrate-binding protein n=1 Tax=Microbacterium oleivorans TaxID=273677 RepID=A0A031FRE5_9MICO|nr:multiple monosaccharide ABC transporter substrate-binding protein [Microbacterium oleivorans]AZS44269.1 Multiple sugar-binding periplasmic receptor ChvE [Microbacterium oleivorans]EZP26887.1 Sugar ABC transporter substrate-binding protein [Microbacterium oleivorans]THE06121.1 sugar ABC transporter substrate-binding protein [Microbacterium oleivorans]
MKLKRIIFVGIAAGALALTACAGGTTAGGSGSGGGKGDGGLIGVAMPTKSSERWIQDGNAVKKALEDQGYKVDLQYAEDDIPTQVSQIENMITKGAEALIVASIDGTTLTEALQNAADADIPVIAYDRLIKGTENVDYYATFDNQLVGNQQAWTVLNGLGLTDLEGKPVADAPKGPFNIELFAGSLDDNNAFFFFNGAMDVLKPYIEDGTLVVKSGQTSIEQAATLRWDGETAQSRMEDILTANYSDGTKVDAVLSPYDGISRGIISALSDAGYSVGDEWPIISGQDAEVDSVKAILSGEQYATIFKDTRELAKVAAGMAVDVLNDEKPEVNDEKTYDNDVKVVPSYLLAPVPVVKDNVKSALVDTGYWTADELGL